MLTHLDFILMRLNDQRDKLASAKSDRDRGWWQHRIAMTEKELAAEYEFLQPSTGDDPMTDDELLAELTA